MLMAVLLFYTKAKVQISIYYYNQERPHSSQGIILLSYYCSPSEAGCLTSNCKNQQTKKLQAWTPSMNHIDIPCT